jgi:hypothetical protein
MLFIKVVSISSGKNIHTVAFVIDLTLISNQLAPSHENSYCDDSALGGSVPTPHPLSVPSDAQCAP